MIKPRLFSDGIEIENYPSLKYATINSYLNEQNYENTAQLVKSLKLKILISENVTDGDTKDNSFIVEKFLF